MNFFTRASYRSITRTGERRGARRASGGRRRGGGRVSLSIVESRWDPGRGRSRQRTVENLGHLDALAAEHADPVAWGRARAAELTEAGRASGRSAPIEARPAQRIDRRAPNRKSLGCAMALSQCAALGVERPLRNRMRGRRVGYDLDAVPRPLVCERIVDPGPRRAAWLDGGRHLFRAGFADDDACRAPDEPAASRDAVVSATNRSIAASGARDPSAAYYGVTDYHFEADGGDGLRRKGAGKERGPNPIVRMGLPQDANGIPMAYRTFPGNAADCRTMIPVPSDMRRDRGVDRVAAVADKGPNCPENIAAAAASGDGFVLSQSVRGTRPDKEPRAWVLSEEGHGRGAGGDARFKSKSRQGFRTVRLRAADTASGRARDVRVDVKYVAFWSERHARRARREREGVIERARGLVANPGAYTRATSHGAARFVRNLHFDGRTGEVIETRGLGLDEQAIAEAERYDGHYLIVTSETGWPDGKVIDTYRGPWGIEGSFRVTKSELGTRPVYVWTPRHMEAHTTSSATWRSRYCGCCSARPACPADASVRRSPPCRVPTWTPTGGSSTIAQMSLTCSWGPWVWRTSSSGS